PVRADRLLNIVAVVQAEGDERDSWTAPGDPAKLAEEFRGWDPVVERLTSRVTETFQWGLFDRAPLDTWVNGRVALLGDAAHAMLPHLGQGGAQTIEDAFALAAALEGVDAAGVGQALRMYELLRKDRATAVQQASRVAGHLFDFEDVEAFDARDAQIRDLAPFYAWLGAHDADSLAVPKPAPATG